MDNSLRFSAEKNTAVNIYLLCGLGTDERLFENLPPLAGYRYIPLPFIKPQNSTSLADYAQLLATTYDFQPPFILGGVSIGGMIAQELAQIVQPEKLLLISTVCSRAEMPRLFRLVNHKFFYPLLTASFLRAVAFVGDKFTKKSFKGRDLFFDMLKKSDDDFLSFGARAALSWYPPKVNVPIIRIHGSRDRVFPLSRIENQEMIVIKNGNHFMVYEMGEEVGEVVERIL